MKQGQFLRGMWLLLAAVLFAGMITGCGGADNAGDFAAEEYYNGYAPSGGDWDDVEYKLSDESYLSIDENKEISTNEESMLTFSLKVDTAAYSNVERYIESGNLPPKDAVRTEELINYFNYDQELSFTDEHPFAIYGELGTSLLNEEKYLAFVRVKTRDIDVDQMPPSNLTFLIDTSGSMNSHDKLPLLQEAFKLLTETLREEDTVSIVTYAGSSAVLLDSVSGADKSAINRAIDSLSSGGSTAGADGIMTAYALAEKNFREDKNNRVILASDGDFNVGISDLDELEKLISSKRDSGVYLSVLGFGTGNIRDDIMETLAKNGNGNYSYIGTLNTAKKVLVEEMGSNLFTVADDVKAQVEFNSDQVESYRLIGYENRMLSNEDFTDDSKDAGEIGAGTDVVMMFELSLKGGSLQNSASGPLFDVRIRYKDPGQPTSKETSLAVTKNNINIESSSDFNFAASVSAFGHLLRDSQFAENITVDDVIALARENLGEDRGGYRAQYLVTLNKYRDLI